VSAYLHARDLSPSAREAVEQILGRALEDNELVNIRTRKLNQAPSPEAKEAARRGLREYFARIDEKTKHIPLDERDEIMDEAIRKVRPGYQPIR